jgi:predicted RNA-binding protein with PIN domain
VQQALKGELSDACVDFTREGEEFYEDIAVCGEALLNTYMEMGSIGTEVIAEAIRARQIFPCYYGSALKLEGVEAFLDGLSRYMRKPQYGNDFSARVYKIGRDARGARLTYLKVTGGMLRVKDRISYDGLEEKIDQIRLYSAEKYETTEQLAAGEVCAVTGLTMTFPGQGLGAEQDTRVPVLEPVLTYQILLPQDVNPADMMGKLKQLEEEDPQLHILWNEELREIHAQMMGQVQIEVLTQLIKERFDISIAFGPGNIVYRETIAEPVEGVGHFEPLRHYAEVHLLLEPGEPGSGVQVASACSEDVLDLNWQRLIATHVMEREHPGVLTGSALTDVKVTILTGRAHTKHTEGGDFRQATYRAIRHGLKRAKSVLLEPMYAFSLEVPQESVGRAMTDLKQRCGRFDAPEFVTGTDVAVLTGTAPVSTMQDYSTEVYAYTKGLGHLTLELSGYDVCHDAQEVVDSIGYDSDADVANPTGSVFCAHGAGFVVPWDEVEDYMHLPYAYMPHKNAGAPGEGAGAQGANGAGVYGGGKLGADGAGADGIAVQASGRAYDVSQAMSSVKKSEEKSTGSWELDKELQQIYAREFGMSREAVEDQERRRWMKKKSDAPKPATVKYDKKGNPIYPSRGPQEEYIIVDGYNIIFAWKDLNELSRVNIDSARDKLLDILSDYQGYKGCAVMVVFDAYRRKDHPGAKSRYQNLEVVYTRTDETADAYIERTVHQISGKYRVTVATNDGLEQLTVLSQGALRMSAENLREEIARVSREGMEGYVR